jgi:hypothetical protein
VEIPAFIVASAGPGLGWLLFSSLSVWVLRGFISGQIVPRSTLEAERVISAGWKAAYDQKAQQLDTILVPLAELQTKVLTSLQSEPHRRPRSEDRS